MNGGDDLGRLRDRVLKLQNHFGQANEDVRQILISADKIEKRAGRIEKLDFSKADAPPEAPRIVGTGSTDLFAPVPRELRAGEWQGFPLDVLARPHDRTRNSRPTGVTPPPNAPRGVLAR